MRQAGLEGIPDLWEATYDLVSQVPVGRVTTYGQVALALGDMVASRFVGLAMSRNDDVVRIPCRRVVRSNGELGGYAGGGPERKATLLEDEGVPVREGKVQDLEKLLFTDFLSNRPLEVLRRRQNRLKGLVQVPSSTNVEVRYVAGVDVAYDGDHAYAAAAVFDYRTGELVDQLIQEGEAKFPYIPTYLAYRELPLVVPLARNLPDDTVLMYDGNGLLHPGGMGVATHAGIATGLPSIGVAKSLLCGTHARDAQAGTMAISLDGRIVGHEILARGRWKPIYASVGQGISEAQMLEIVKRFLKHRVPEPTRMAHILAERARRGTSHK